MEDEDNITISRRELDCRIAEAKEAGAWLTRNKCAKTESVIKLLEGIIELLKG